MFFVLAAVCAAGAAFAAWHHNLVAAVALGGSAVSWLVLARRRATVRNLNRRGEKP